jgi:hypothetical protein
MAYTRGKYYIYEDVNGKFFFNGVFIPKSVIDEFVVMRYAELEKEGKVKRIENRAMKKWQGNFGCDALLEKHGKRTAIEMIESLLKKKKSKKIKKRRIN